MGNVDWPLKDIRKDPSGSWNLYNVTGEFFGVPTGPDSYSYYSVYLVEVPARANLDGSNSAPQIECPVGTPLTIIETGPPSSGEALLNYDKGSISVHSSKAGETGIAGYWGTGSLIETAELNDINERAEFLESGSSGITGVTGAQGLQGPAGTTGLDGEQGVTGALGNSGNTGVIGLIGGIGTDGLRGITGAFSIGESGFIGYTGVNGLTGLQGAIGPTGISGNTGQLGYQGTAGDPPLNLARYKSPLFTGQIWTVNHGLGQIPAIQAYNSSGEVVEPEEIINGTETSYITHFTPTNGYAICALGGIEGPQGSTGVGPIGATGLVVAFPKYDQEFVSATTTWVVNHSLDANPMIQVYDPDWNSLSATGIDGGNLVSRVFFNSPQTGYAVVAAGGTQGETGAQGPGVRRFGLASFFTGGETSIQSGYYKDIRVGATGNISKITVLAGEVGDLELDLWRASYEEYPPTDSHSITGGSPITLTNEIKKEVTDFSGWETGVSLGDTLRLYVDSADAIVHSSIIIEIVPGVPYTSSSSSSTSTSSTSSSSTSLSSSSTSFSSSSLSSYSSSSSMSISSSSFSFSSSSSSNSLSSSSVSSSSSSSMADMSWIPLKGYNRNLISVWDCNDDIATTNQLTDKVGGYDGVGNGGIDSRYDWLDEGALDFNGTNAYVTVSHVDEYIGTSGTLSMWYISDLSSQEQVIFDKSLDLGGPLIIKQLSTNKVQFEYRYGTSDKIVATTESVVDMSWHHLAVVWGYVPEYSRDHSWSGRLASYDSYLQTVYELNETSGPLMDSVGPNNGVAVGSPIYEVETRSGTGVEFNGSSSFDVPTDSTLTPSTITVSAWVKIDTFAENAGIISKAGGTGTTFQNGYGLLLGPTDTVRFVVYASTDCWGSDCEAQITADEWHLVVGTYDGAAARLYIDGTLRDSFVLTGSINHSGDDLRVGSLDFGTLSINFEGIIDETCIWSTALDSGAISDLWHGSWGRFYSGTSTIETISRFQYVSFYVDGECLEGEIYRAPYDDQSSAMVFGRNQSSSDSYLDGGIDAIYYWDAALPYEGILDLFNEGYGAYYSSSSSSTSHSSSSTTPYPLGELFDPTITQYDPYLVHVWRLNESSGPISRDDIANDDGIGEGDPEYGVHGKNWKAIRLDGVNDLVRSYDSSSLDAVGDVSISFWVKPSLIDQGDALRALVDKSGGDPRWNGGFYIALDNRSEYDADNALVFGVGRKIVAESEQFDEYTMVLLHLDGEDGLGEATDESRYGRNVWPHSASVTNDIGVFDGSMYIEDGGDIVVTSLTVGEFSLGFKWTIDFWVRYIPTTGSGTLVSTRGADDYGYEIGVNYNQNFFFRGYGTGQSTAEMQTSGYLITEGIWYHVAVISDGADVDFYINGHSYLTFPYSTNLSTNSDPFIGSPQQFGEPFHGYVDEFRISKGIARWTSDFTPPDRPYEKGRFNSDHINFYDDNLLVVYSLDDESDGKGTLDLENYGVSFVVGIDGFAAEFGGADRLTPPLSNKFFPNDGLTISIWVNSTDWTSTSTIVSIEESGGYALGTNLAASTKVFTLKRNGTYADLSYDTGLNLLDNTWHHFVATYDGRYTKLYVDGSLVDEDDAGTGGPHSIQYSYVNSLHIGAEATSGTSATSPYWTGKLDSCYMWSEALTEEAIADLYNDGDGGFYAPDVRYTARDFNYDISRSQNALTNTDWHHIVCVWISGSRESRIYIDGETAQRETIETAGDPELGDSDLDLTFGHFQGDEDWPQLFFKGDLDEVYIWNTNISRFAVESLYNDGQGRFFSSSSSSSLSSSSSSESHSSSSTSPSASFSSSSSMTPDRTWGILSTYDSNLFAWNLNETSGTRYAASGGYDLEDYNGTTSGNGKSNKAAKFTGTERLEVPVEFLGYFPFPEYDGESPIIIKGDFTLSLWVMVDSTPSADSFLLVKYDELYDYQFRMIWGSNGKLHIDRDSGSNSSLEYTIDPNTWYNIILAGNASTNDIDFYINGDLKETVSWHSGDTENAGTFVGGPPFGTYGWLEGRIDEIYYWDVRLPDGVLDDIFNYGYGKFYLASSSSSSTSFSSSSISLSSSSSTSVSSSSLSSSSTSLSSSSTSSSTPSSSSSSSSTSDSSTSTSSSSTANTGWPFVFREQWDRYLIAAWDFNDGLNCHDLKGNYKGTTRGNLSVAQGKNGNAIRFPGQEGSYIEIPDLDPTAYTNGIISCWVKLKSIDDDQMILIMRGEDEFTGGYDYLWRLEYLKASGFRLSTTVYSSTTYVEVSYTTLDEWAHLLIYSTGGNMYFYLNGVQIDSDGPNWWSDCTYAPTYVPGRYTYIRMGESFNGDIDSLYLWNNYLPTSYGAIDILYNEGHGKFYSYGGAELTQNTEYHCVLLTPLEAPSADTFLAIHRDESAGSEYYKKLNDTWQVVSGYDIPRKIWIGDDWIEVDDTEGSNSSEIVGADSQGLHSIAFKFETEDPGEITAVDLFSQSFTINPGAGITDSLMVWYDFNDGFGRTVRDRSGNGNDGTLSSFPSLETDFWRRGRQGMGGALRFKYPNENEYIDAHGDFDGWEPPSFTLSFWNYAWTTLSDNAQYIGAISGWNMFRFTAYEDGRIWCGIQETADGRFTGDDLPAGTYETGKWQHFCFTFNNGYARFYKNGILLATKDGMPNPQAWDGFRIGAPSSKSFGCLMEDLRVYERALTEEEVAALGNLNPLDLTLEVREGHSIGEGKIVATSTRSWIPSAGWFSFTSFDPLDRKWDGEIASFDDHLLAAWSLDEGSGRLADGAGGHDGIPHGSLSYGATGMYY